MDNCFRENKNQYVIAYLNFLVKSRVFHEVIVSFLPVGHTHEDIDQFFSRVSIYMKRNDAVTMNEFAECVRNSQKPRPFVQIIDSCKYEEVYDW